MVGSVWGVKQDLGRERQREIMKKKEEKPKVEEGFKAVK